VALSLYALKPHYTIRESGSYAIVQHILRFIPLQLEAPQKQIPVITHYKVTPVEYISLPGHILYAGLEPFCLLTFQQQ
jgi:hypothetical protein